jgi:hypothetical protein
MIKHTAAARTKPAATFERIARFRPQPDPQPAEQPKPLAQPSKAKSRPSIQPVRANRNFLNYPLARGIRTKANWQWDAATKHWVAHLPGNKPSPAHNIIRLVLPQHVDQKRCPTAIDINLIYYLLSRIQNGKTGQVVLPSLTSVLPGVGLTVHTKNLDRLKDSFVYLADLSLSYSQWYVPPDQHVERVLPPLIKKKERKPNSSRITITINREWVQLAQDKTYYRKLPLPLPTNTAAQNLVQLVLTRPRQTFNTTKPMDMRWVTRRVGLNHSHRNPRFSGVSGASGVLARAQKWFDAKNGILKLLNGGTNGIPPDMLAFLVRLPEPRRQKKTDTNDRGGTKKTDTNDNPPPGKDRH